MLCLHRSVTVGNLSTTSRSCGRWSMTGRRLSATCRQTTQERKRSEKSALLGFHTIVLVVSMCFTVSVNTPYPHRCAHICHLQGWWAGNKTHPICHGKLNNGKHALQHYNSLCDTKVETWSSWAPFPFPISFYLQFLQCHFVCLLFEICNSLQPHKFGVKNYLHVMQLLQTHLKLPGRLIHVS